MKEGILVVVVVVGELILGLIDSKYWWGPPDGDVLWAIGWMVSEETWILQSSVIAI